MTRSDWQNHSQYKVNKEIALQNHFEYSELEGLKVLSIRLTLTKILPWLQYEMVLFLRVLWHTQRQRVQEQSSSLSFILIPVIINSQCSRGARQLGLKSDWTCEVRWLSGPLCYCYHQNWFSYYKKLPSILSFKDVQVLSIFIFYESKLIWCIIYWTIFINRTIFQKKNHE